MFDVFVSLLHPLNILALLVSTGLGVTVGALPGITVVLSLAVLLGMVASLPFSFTLSILIGVYIGATYGGSITAILLNIPGTPSSAATALDGYPLCRLGRAAEAIQVSRLASVIGTAIGAALLFIFSPLLTKAALHFASPDYFSLALFGIIACGSASGSDNQFKGWICGLLGLLLASVGLDEIESSQRFVFGITGLLSGVSFVPVLIGLYAIPEVIAFYANPGAASVTVQSVRIGSVRETLGTVWRRLRLIVQSALTGVGIGVLPGVGEDVAAWTAYGVAKKTSRDPDSFGKGNLDGVIAPEVANNAAIGGSLSPVLSLGVPGSGSAAILLAALMMYGLQPGPMLAMDNPEILPQMAFTLFLADICLMITAWAMLRPILCLLRVPRGYLMPCILAMATMGAYAINLSRFDLYVMLAAGGLGCLLRWMRYPPGPLALGLILGKMLDLKFRNTLVISDGSFLPFVTQPVSCFFLFIIAALLVRHIVILMRSAKSTKPVPTINP